jgi:hypothetical protein
VEFAFGLDHALAIIRVDDKDETLGVLEVVAPQRPDLVLTADVPHREADVFVFHSLDVEANCRNGRDNLAELEFVENCRFTGRIETDWNEGGGKFLVGFLLMFF